jgi:hypothetical protein
MVDPVKVSVQRVGKADVNIQNTIDTHAISKLVQKQDATPIRMKVLIDNLYEKEKRYIYQKQGSTRADFVGNQSVIFNLKKVHDLPINHLRNQVLVNSQSTDFGVIKGMKVEFEIPK